MSVGADKVCKLSSHMNVMYVVVNEFCISALLIQLGCPFAIAILLNTEGALTYGTKPIALDFLSQGCPNVLEDVIGQRRDVPVRCPFQTGNVKLHAVKADDAIRGVEVVDAVVKGVHVVDVVAFSFRVIERHATDSTITHTRSIPSAGMGMRVLGDFHVEGDDSGVQQILLSRKGPRSLAGLASGTAGRHRSGSRPQLDN